MVYYPEKRIVPPYLPFDKWQAGRVIHEAHEGTRREKEIKNFIPGRVGLLFDLWIPWDFSSCSFVFFVDKTNPTTGERRENLGARKCPAGWGGGGGGAVAAVVASAYGGGECRSAPGEEP
jgi:hypothetical protein